MHTNTKDFRGEAQVKTTITLDQKAFQLTVEPKVLVNIPLFAKAGPVFQLKTLTNLLYSILKSIHLQ